MDCILCGKCKKSCPAYTLYREELFSPRGKMLLLDQKIDRDLVDFKCFFCGNCISSCPFDIDVPVEFLFSTEKEIELKSNGENILVDTIESSSSQLEKLQSLVNLEFTETVQIKDGVEELFKDNNYEIISEFREFLSKNSSYNLYFTEKSSANVAKRLGHVNSFMITDLLEIKIHEIPKELTRYYRFLSKEQLELLDIDFSKINEEIFVNVAFDFGNSHLKFYMDTL